MNRVRPGRVLVAYSPRRRCPSAAASSRCCARSTCTRRCSTKPTGSSSRRRRAWTDSDDEQDDAPTEQASLLLDCPDVQDDLDLPGACLPVTGLTFRYYDEIGRRLARRVGQHAGQRRHLRPPARGGRDHPDDRRRGRLRAPLLHRRRPAAGAWPADAVRRRARIRHHARSGAHRHRPAPGEPDRMIRHERTHELDFVATARRRGRSTTSAGWRW